MELYKDEKGINHRTKIIQNKYIEELADICKEAFSDFEKKDSVLRKRLRIPKNVPATPKHDPCHKKCEGCGSDRKTEKRICRCMYYYNQNRWPKKCEKEKNSCQIFAKWINKGKIEVIQYEWPTEYVLKKVGGIDLILRDQSGVEYGVEVKPYGSKETVSRMVAEILSYTIGTPFNGIAIKPAIAVFAGSEQFKMIEYLRKDNNENWKTIESYVQVFIINYSIKDHEAKFIIEKF